MNIGAFIKSRRLELGLTLENVGERVGVGKSTVRKWETGIIENMRRDKIAKLAEVLEISPDVLINGGDLPKQQKPPDAQEVSQIKNELLQMVENLTEKEAAVLLASLKSVLGKE